MRYLSFPNYLHFYKYAIVPGSNSAALLFLSHSSWTKTRCHSYPTHPNRWIEIFDNIKGSKEDRKISQMPLLQSSSGSASIHSRNTGRAVFIQMLITSKDTNTLLNCTKSFCPFWTILNAVKVLFEHLARTTSSYIYTYYFKIIYSYWYISIMNFVLLITPFLRIMFFISLF